MMSHTWSESAADRDAAHSTSIGSVPTRGPEHRSGELVGRATHYQLEVQHGLGE